MKKFPTYKSQEYRQRKARRKERQLKIATERNCYAEAPESFLSLKETSR